MTLIGGVMTWGDRMGMRMNGIVEPPRAVKDIDSGADDTANKAKTARFEAAAGGF